MESGKMKVAIVGGGLVGSLSACYFAKRGHDVDVYEYRKDIRSSDLMQGKSINLALSTRGRKALRQIGVEEAIIQNHGIAMRARMVHAIDGALNVIPYDSLHNECIYSVGRKYLNEILLTETEKYSNVKLHFEHKFVFGNLKTGEMTFQKVSNNSSVTAVADLIVGADGAFSAVRRQMMKLPMFNYNQTYIEHGYLELCIPPTPDKYFAMPHNYLHIWPRGFFMMIALPNQDFSWTVTVFMPFDHFAKLDSPNALVCFFESHFPDAIPLIGKERLITDFFTAKPSYLVSIKCDPYHVGNKSVIIGDAAHAMVPFYGQGMNAGFEDCSLLDELMTQHSHDLGVVLRLFSESRNRDAHAICDLAMYNYIEMRDLVNRRSFLWRKKLDNFLFWLLPKTWIPLYNSVTFSDMKYSQCIQNKKWQDKIVNQIIFTAGAFGTLIVALATAVQLQRTELRPLVYSAYDQVMVTLFNAPPNA